MWKERAEIDKRQTLQNGQTHSNNWSAVADFNHFVGLVVKGLLQPFHWLLSMPL